MHGPELLVRTLSKATRSDKNSTHWQYHSRSDHHSKVACVGIVFDLLLACPLLNRHVADGVVHFGINHEMRDFVHDRKKNLDLVLCTPLKAPSASRSDPKTLTDLFEDYEIPLEESERSALEVLPRLSRAAVGSVLIAL